jgi:predicted enzyme related to lactoylglutathione lyase
MGKVLCVGGVFFKSPDPKKLYDWYEKWLKFEINKEYGASFPRSDMPEKTQVAWSAFSDKTKYFDPATKDFMFNLVVDNLDEALAQVKEGGAEIVGDIQAEAYGRFGWFVDPDGNKVELWEVPK